jgi:pimeloyl-ACP methyl ester carboxylesterase
VAYASLNHVDLHYLDEGEGEPVLLLFNGAGLRLSFWGELATEFARRGRVVRFDQRAVGGTRFDGPYTLESVAADARALLDLLGVERVVAVGHAWGGRVAQVLARDEPERLQGLVICGTGGIIPPKHAPQTQQQARAAAAAGDRSRWEEAIAELYCSSSFVRRQPERARAVFDELWEGRADGRGAADASRATPSESYAGKARCPVLLVYGREDRVGTEENALELHRRLPGSRLVFIEDAAHFVIREQPERVLQAIGEFVDGLPRASDEIESQALGDDGSEQQR